jgi:hypothetical protein
VGVDASAVSDHASESIDTAQCLRKGRETIALPPVDPIPIGVFVAPLEEPPAAECGISPIVQPPASSHIPIEGEIRLDYEDSIHRHSFDKVRPILDRFGLDLQGHGFTAQEGLQSMEDAKQLPIPEGWYFHTSRIHELSDGGRLVVANTGTNPGQRFTTTGVGIFRYRADGTLDRTFGSQGLRLLDAPVPLVPLGAHVNEQGEVLLGVSAGEKMGLMKFHASGELDRSFGAQGMILTAFVPGRNYLQGMHIQRDGKIVLTNIFYSPDSIFYSPDRESSFHIRQTFIRFLPNGDVDRSFGDMGVLFVKIWDGYAAPVGGAEFRFKSPYLVTRDSAPERIVPSTVLRHAVTAAVPNNNVRAGTSSAMTSEVERVPVHSIPNDIPLAEGSVAGLIAESSSDRLARSLNGDPKNSGDLARATHVFGSETDAAWVNDDGAAELGSVLQDVAIQWDTLTNTN